MADGAAGLDGVLRDDPVGGHVVQRIVIVALPECGVGAGFRVAGRTGQAGRPSVKIDRARRSMASLAGRHIGLGFFTVQFGRVVGQIMARSRTAGMTTDDGTIVISHAARQAAWRIIARLGSILRHLMAHATTGLDGALRDPPVGGTVVRCVVVQPLPASGMGTGFAVATGGRTVGAGGVKHRRIGQKATVESVGRTAMTDKTFSQLAAGDFTVPGRIAEGMHMGGDRLTIRMAGQTTGGLVLPRQVCAMARFAA